MTPTRCSAPSIARKKRCIMASSLFPKAATGLCFGGEACRTLYIGARSSLYAIRTKAPGAAIADKQAKISR